MKETIRFLMTAIITGLSCSAFSQSPLSQVSLTNWGGFATLQTSLSVGIGIKAEHNPLISPTMLFEKFLISMNNVGQTYRVGTIDDPDFTLFSSLLTDSQISFMTHTVTLGPMSTTTEAVPEATFLKSLPPGSNGRDLNGFGIDYYEVRLDSLHFVSPGYNPNRDGIWTDYSYSATFSVYGHEIPEPASLALSALGMALAAMRFWRRKHGCAYDRV